MKDLKLFKIVIGQWLEAKIDRDWVIGQVVDMTRDGRVIWVETHEDTFEFNRFAGELRELVI